MTSQQKINDIHQMCLDHFNEPVVVGLGVVRLIGYGEDADDCYLILNTPERGVYWHTAVGGYTFLDRLSGENAAGPWDDLKRLDSSLCYAGVPKADKFTADIRTESFLGQDLTWQHECLEGSEHACFEYPLRA